MLERLYDILFEFKEYVVLACCLIFAFVLLSLNDAPQIKQLRSAVAVVYGIAQQQVSILPQYFALKQENEILRRKNLELADEVSRLREAKLQNFRLRKLLDLQQETSFRVIASKVVAKNLLLFRNTLTLDVGTSDGVQESMPVLNEDGLVGMVTNTSSHYAIVNILLNTTFRVSGKVQRSRVDGIVRWNGDVLLFDNVPKTRDVQVGDVVVTSGYSQIFPPNIRVGVVKSIDDQVGSLFKRIVITPAVDFVRLEEVFVLTYTPSEERKKLEETTSVEKRR